jgi:integrase
MCAALSTSVVTDNALLLGGYAPSTQKKYRAAIDKFAVWCDHHGITPRGHSQLDFHLSRYMLQLWLDGKSKVDASCTMYGLDMLVPGIRSHLPLSRRSLRGYNRLVPSISRPPMPWPVAVALAMWLTFNDHGVIGIGVLLSFDCYLRIGELLQLVTTDIAFGRDPRLGLEDDTRVHIHLRRTKTGPNKGVEVRNHHIKVLLKALCQRVTNGGRLFNYHVSTYRRWFNKALDALHLSSDYTPHCLRHGGATHDYLNGMAMADVQLRGRWASSKSATHYIQQGRQLMMLQHVPAIVDQVGRHELRNLSLSILLAHANSLAQNTRPRRNRGLMGVGTTSLIN